MLHGQVCAPPTETVTGAEGAPRLALSSVARTRSLAVEPPARHEYVHDVVPLAGCQRVPPSVETSTPATVPPPASDAVPVTVTVLPLGTVDPSAGEVIVAVGAVWSVVAVAATSPVCRVDGCAFMSASRFTVACCMSRSTGVPEKSWSASRPQDHWTVPAPKTRAPLGARYSVRLW